MSEIKSRECRFVFHIPDGYSNKDTHIVKEILHYEDGTHSKALRLLEDFKRPYWVTMENYRDHNDKKEAEKLNRVREYMSTESGLARSIASRLDSRYTAVKDMRSILRNQFVYGCDTNSRTYIKHQYQTKYGDIVTPYEVCIFDIEADINTGDITILSIATKEKIYTVITKKYLQQKFTTKDNSVDILKDIKPKLDYLYNKHIPKTDISKNVSVEYDVVDNELDGILAIFRKLHAWEPDFVAVWNITYDVGKLLDVLTANNINPASVFSSPKLPDNLKRFKFKLGPTQKITASGKYKPINPEEQWHTVICPASFYWIDAMSTHRYVRVGGKSVPGGYSLDNVLKHELGDKLGKLKFEDEKSSSTKGVDWHKYMSAERPLEYIIYNQWDVLSVLELDEVTGDLQNVMPMLAGVSNFDIFNSGPKRIIDALHFFYLDNDRVLGTKDPTGDDKDLLGLGQWINNSIYD